MIARADRVALLAAACATLFVGHLPTAVAAPRYSEYVALGDSWSAGATVVQATDRFVPMGCVQSRANYPKQVADALEVPVFRDATCGAAETGDMTGAQDAPLGGSNAAQFDRLTPTTDLVTLGIGGNDAGLADAVFDCLTVTNVGAPCMAKYVVGGVDRMSANIAATEPGVIAVIESIRERSPRARILVVDYFAAIGDRGCFPTIPITDADAEWLRAKMIEINGMLARAAQSAAAEFVDTYSSSIGHDACQPAGIRWVEGLAPISGNPPGLAVPFHPNQLGGDYQAGVVLAALGG